MHFSRMCTARLLPASPSMHCSQEGVCSWGGVGVVHQQTPPVNRITDTCKNITLP